MKSNTWVIMAVMHAREQELESLLVARSAVSGPRGKDVPPIVKIAIAKPSESLINPDILSYGSIDDFLRTNDAED